MEPLADWSVLMINMFNLAAEGGMQRYSGSAIYWGLMSNAAIHKLDLAEKVDKSGTRRGVKIRWAFWQDNLSIHVLVRTLTNYQSDGHLRVDLTVSTHWFNSSKKPVLVSLCPPVHSFRIRYFILIARLTVNPRMWVLLQTSCRICPIWFLLAPVDLFD